MNTPVPSAHSIHDGIDHWEEELYLSCRRRARVAYMIAAASLVMVILALGAAWSAFQRPPTPPVVITVDKHTGLANVSSALGTISLDDDEAITQALIYQYVRDRETYAAWDHRERLNAIFKRSQDAAASDLRALYAKDNPNDPFKVYGAHGTVDVRIRSVVLTGRNRATVRIVKEARAQPEADPRRRNYVITLTFGFDRDGEMTLEERWTNPTGFFVTNYRLDEEAS